MTDQLQCWLKALTELGGTRNSKVALTARQLLISVQTPSYELRRNQVSDHVSWLLFIILNDE